MQRPTLTACLPGKETLFRITRVVIARSIGSEMNGIESEEEEEVNGWLWGDILHHRRRRIEGPLISLEEDGGRQWKCSLFP